MGEEQKLKIIIEAENKAEPVIEDLNKTMTDLATTMTQVQNSASQAFSSVTSSANQANTGISKLGTSISKNNKTTKASIFSSLKYAISISTIAMAVNKSIGNATDYVENLNLFGVAMKDNVFVANDFANSLSNAFGQDKSQMIRYMGLFASLTESMGNSNETALQVSKSLTQIGYDLASLYNRSIEQTMTALSSGLVGQTKPLRNFGIDTTYATLQVYALQNGITEQVKILSQSDKQLLRTIAILDQSRNAWGDMSETIENPANQMKVFNAQVKKLSIAFGNLMMGVVNTVLPYLNAFVMVLIEIVGLITKFLGITIPDVQMSANIDGADKDLTAFNDSLDNTNKKLGLMPFDELTNISTKTQATSATGTSDYELRLQEKIKALQKEIETAMDNTKMRAIEIRDAVMEWLGFTRDINGELKFTDLTFGTLLIAAGGIATALLILSKLGIFSLIGQLIAGLGSIGTSIGTFFSTISASLSGGALTTFFAQIIVSIEAFAMTLGVSFGTATAIIGGVIALIAGLVVAFIDLWNNSETFRLTIINALTEVWNVFTNLYNQIMLPLVNLIGSILTPIFNVLLDVIMIIYQNAIKPLAEFIGTVFFKALGGIAEIINKTLIPAFKIIIDTVTWVMNNVFAPLVNLLWNSLKPTFEGVFGGIKKIIEGVTKTISGLIDIIVGLFTFNGSKMGKGIEQLFSGIGDIFKGALNILITGLNAVIGKPFKDINNMMNKIRGISIFGAKPFNGLWNENPIPVPQIPKLANGGIITQPTMYGGAFTGENYRQEAIIPLQNTRVVEDFSNMIGANLASYIGGIADQPIVNQFYVDGIKVTESVNKRTQQFDNQFGRY